MNLPTATACHLYGHLPRWLSLVGPLPFGADRPELLACTRCGDVLNVSRGTWSPEMCDHEWRDGELTDGRAIKQCARCPRWRLVYTAPLRDPERLRRPMEETSRHLGEHRDV